MKSITFALGGKFANTPKMTKTRKKWDEKVMEICFQFFVDVAVCYCCFQSCFKHFRWVEIAFDAWIETEHDQQFFRMKSIRFGCRFCVRLLSGGERGGGFTKCEKIIVNLIFLYRLYGCLKNNFPFKTMKTVIFTDPIYRPHTNKVNHKNRQFLLINILWNNCNLGLCFLFSFFSFTYKRTYNSFYLSSNV